MGNCKSDSNVISDFLTLKPYSDDEKLIVPNEKYVKLTPEMNLKEMVQLNLKLKNPIVNASSFVNQVIPMLVSLKAENMSGKKNVPVDLVCVLDKSGSMSGKKMEQLKNTFNYLLEFLSESDRLSIVQFDTTARRLTPLINMTQAGKDLTLSVVSRIESDYGTDIGQGMKIAFDILKQRRQINSMTGIFLLSDGLDSSANQTVKDHLINSRLHDNFSIHCFGYGCDHDPELMTNIADIADGNFYFIEKLETVDECFVNCLGGLLSSIAKDITISISPNDKSFLKGLEISKAYGDASMWTKNGQTYITKLSQLISGRTKDFILEVKVPKYSKDITDEQKNATLVNAIASMTSLGNEKYQFKNELVVTMANENEELEQYPNDRDVMKNFYRVKSGEIMQKAKVLADDKEYIEAQKTLKGLEEELENCELKNDKFIQSLIGDVKRAYENASPDRYEESGRLDFVENVRTQIQQRFNVKSAVPFQNDIQESMNLKLQCMKEG